MASHKNAASSSAAPVNRGVPALHRASGVAPVGAGKTVTLRVAYRSQGLDRWTYNFGGDVSQVRDFTLRMTTNFKDIDFPDNTLSPGVKREIPGGWELIWSYKNLVTGFPIAMVMPEKLQPGPLAGEISTRNWPRTVSKNRSILPRPSG